MNHRFALSIKTDTAGRWLWGFADGTDVLTGTSTARSRDDAVLCALAASHDHLTAGGPVEVVLSLHESSGIWGLTAELATHFAGVALVPFTDADAGIRAAAQAALRPAASETGRPEAARAAGPGDRRHRRIGRPRLDRVGLARQRRHPRVRLGQAERPRVRPGKPGAPR